MYCIVIMHALTKNVNREIKIDHSLWNGRHGTTPLKGKTDTYGAGLVVCESRKIGILKKLLMLYF